MMKHRTWFAAASVTEISFAMEDVEPKENMPLQILLLQGKL